ncbi:MAG: thioredoxin-disulfide reductase [Proteobacteria bacterium]|nr:thioredoxin-disulfide reductase [Pseudomonadota bacterium]
MADFDVVIIGGGPAGMSAGIYLARSGRKTVILEAGAPGGQVFINHSIENYPGFAEATPGAVLAEAMQKQVERLGVEIKNSPVNSIKKDGKNYKIKGFNIDMTTRAIIIATGSKPKPLGVPGEERFFGAGVSYCSTCDGMFFKGKDVFVVGGGNSAVYSAEHLSRICNSVTLVHRRNEFRAEPGLVADLKGYKNIRIMKSNELVEITGDKKVEGVILKDINTSKTSSIKADAVFIYVGSIPQNSLVEGMLELSDYGYIMVKDDMSTSLPGIFAAGDVVNKKYRQIVTAVSDGCIAALSASDYLK